MKLLNFIFIVIFIATITFLYTHLGIESVKLSYEIKKNRAEFNNLLDHRSELEYNVAKLKAPTYLEIQLAKENVRLVQPERWQVLETTGLKEETAYFTPPSVIRNILGFFVLKSEAQATPADL